MAKATTFDLSRVESETEKKKTELKRITARKEEVIMEPDGRK
jgi:hypothetical protein